MLVRGWHNPLALVSQRNANRIAGMQPSDLDYYRQRAIVERDRASTAPTEVIAAVHERLAAGYEELIELHEAGSTRTNLHLVPSADQHEPVGAMSVVAAQSAASGGPIN